MDPKGISPPVTTMVIIDITTGEKAFAVQLHDKGPIFTAKVAR
jgi:hypothetical protein